MPRGPIPLGTLFELPLAEFGSAATGSGEAGLTVDALRQLQLAPTTQQEALAESGAAAASVAATRGPTCIACSIGVSGNPGFASAEEQRAHFSLDWHRYNVKRRAARQPPVSEDAFAALVEDERAEVGSISGSESEDSEEEEEAEVQGAAGMGGGPQFAFTASDGKRYACWRALVAPERDLQRAAAAAGAAAGTTPPLPGAAAETSLAALRTLRQHGGRWAVVMLRGGHFAAGVFHVDPARVANPRQPDKFEALAHKSAHRYVVRAGQGGKQSAKDASGKFARSAGSRLRRYNEAALQRDVAEALSGWRELLEGCSLIFVHAPSSNWQQLFGGEAPLLDRGDPRIRRVPFTTRRPTFSETKRVLRVLVTLYQLPEAATEGHAAAEAVAASHKAAAGAVAEATTVERGQQQQQQQQAAAAAVAAKQEAAAAAAAAAEEEARRKKAEKRARQKAKQKEARQAETAASRAAAEEAARQVAEDEIGLAAAAVAAMSSKLTAKPAPVSRGASGQGRALRLGRVLFMAAAAAVVLAASQQQRRQQRRW